MGLLVIVHAAATWFMVGLIWMVQTVHYPLFRRVGAGHFVVYEAEHTRRMGGLLAVPAFIEVATGAALVWVRPDGISLTLVLVAGALLAAAWVSTLLVQVPLHGRLARAFDELQINRLVTTNWWRTLLWSARGVAVAAMLAS